MHKKNRRVQLLFSCFFLLPHFFLASYFYQTPIDTSIQSFYISKPLEEGFSPGTLIKIQDGYEVIENIAIGDIVIDAHGCPTAVIAITRRFVDKYIELHLQDSIISAGCDQQFYCSSPSSWIKACDIRSSHTKYITTFTIIHALTTASHTLVVTSQDIPAHNAAAILCSASTICCGYITITNPVIATLGGLTLSLAAIAYNAYQQCKNKDECSLVDIPDSVILAERFYYEQRKESLNQLKQELINIKNGLQIIRGLHIPAITHQLLSHHTYDTVSKNQLLSIAQEKKLSDLQKNRLRDVRENELISLEKQIYDIQLLLALHVNQVIESVEYAQKLYNSNLTEIENAVESWNNNRERMTIDLACKLYKYNLLREHLALLMRQTFNELFFIAEYYHACTSTCIQSSTTIISTLEYLAPIIAEKKQWIVQEEKLACSNSAIIERYFDRNDISVLGLRNEAQKEFDVQQKQRNIEILKKLEVQQQQHISGCFSGGPKKDDDEDENKKHLVQIEIYEKNAAHIFRNEPGHFPIDTPAARKLLIDIASDGKNFMGKCKYGNEWYAKILEDGQQIWASVRNGFIRNGGLNQTPHHFSNEIGLSRLIK